MKSRVFIVSALLNFLIPDFSLGQDGESTKKIEHYVGFQVNELVRNVINLSNSAAISNPYFLLYSFNSTNSGYGMNFAAGYSYIESNEGDALTPGKRINENASFRLGPERKFKWGDHWIGLLGVDVIYAHTMLKQTTTTFITPLVSTQNTLTVKSEDVGAGLRGGIYYAFNDRILLGTETSYSFLLRKENVWSGLNNSENTSKRLNFSAPMALFLTLRF